MFIKNETSSKHVFPSDVGQAVVYVYQTFTTLWTDSLDDRLMIFSLFFLENRL